jgi:hypothetical protein
MGELMLMRRSHGVRQHQPVFRGATLPFVALVLLAGCGGAHQAVQTSAPRTATASDPVRRVAPIRRLVPVAAGNLANAIEFAKGLARHGCQFALDDFGAGFGGFYYLKYLPCQYLKIDGEFIRTLPASPVDQVFVRAMVELAHGLGKQTIAEFVEDEQTLQLLGELGVDYAQGYHIGRPAPLPAQLDALTTS